MKNDSCLTVSRRAAIIRQDAEENYDTLLTLGESMRRAYQVEELIDRMRWYIFGDGTTPISACNEQTEPAFPLQGH